VKFTVTGMYKTTSGRYKRPIGGEIFGTVQEG
jgi:hypothetical protein